MIRRPFRALPLLLSITAVSLAPPSFAAGADATPSLYSLGNQTMSISAGAFFPLFLLGKDSAIGSTNLSVGAVGFIDWSAYLSSSFRIGVALGGTFTFDPNYSALLMLPVVAKASYLVDFYPWEIPLTLGLGINYLKYGSDSTVDLLLRPGTGLFWTYSSSWSFGLNLDYWWDMQFAKGTLTGGIAVGNFLEVSLSALYHF